jgi:hypothetical protein
VSFSFPENHPQKNYTLIMAASGGFENVKGDNLLIKGYHV